MALLFPVTEQSTVPCFPTIYLFLGDHFGVDKKKGGDHFGVGIISGAVQVYCFYIVIQKMRDFSVGLPAQ